MGGSVLEVVLRYQRHNPEIQPQELASRSSGRPRSQVELKSSTAVQTPRSTKKST